MAALDDLINQIDDEVLRERIREEVKRANKQKKFGLVFEQHLPEATPLYDVPVKKGSVVSIKGNSITDIYQVEAISEGEAVCLQRSTKERVKIPVNDLVAVAQFGEPIYPYLQPIDSVRNAPDSDLWHTLIEADNYHALQLLEYLYAGKVDCIYIDPPYNTGARDWKYNNDYVDGADSYRHSKWLSFMEKRLLLAKKLLNPKDSVLIVTIDEKEYHHLACVLEDLFPEARIQMVSTIINAGGSVRTGEFSRTDEYIFFVRFGDACVCPLPLGSEWRGGKQENEGPVLWRSMLRGGDASARSDRPKMFFPILVDRKTNEVIDVGPSLPLGIPKEDYTVPDGCDAVWPIRKDGSDGRWRIGLENAKSIIEQGFIKSNLVSGRRTISYLAAGVVEAIEKGEIAVSGRGANLKFDIIDDHKIIPGTAWHIASHDASKNGTAMLKDILNEKAFSFPKSVYAVHDTLRFFVNNKPNALIVDFFAGSGTTLHAVNLLNAEDGGHRCCIMVTNNEVSEAEADALTKKGYKPGDIEWEKLGIARYVTWPRTVCSIKGVDKNGDPLKNDYLGSDPEHPRAMADGFAANAVFFKLGFLDKTAVSLGRKFKEMLPLLWMKAGARGPCPSLEGEDIPPMMILPENQMAVLTAEWMFEEFAEKVNADRAIKTVFLVTDSDTSYKEMVAGLKKKDTHQLYREYLDNFRINQNKS